MEGKKSGRDRVVVPMERITQAILLIRGQKVMLGRSGRTVRGEREGSEPGGQAQHRAFPGGFHAPTDR